MASIQISRSDLVGIGSATLCVAHCLLTPILISMAAAYGWWPGLSYLFVLVSFYAAFETSQHSVGSPWLSLIWISFTLLFVSVLFEDGYAWLEIIGYLASAGLILGHLFNIRYCKNCRTRQTK